MASEVVDTIILSGEDSINFANNLFRPSIDFLHSNSQILASIEKNIHITDTDNGFVADIADLDLDLIFKREEMIEEEVLRCREGKKFEQKYLRKEYLKENP